MADKVQRKHIVLGIVVVLLLTLPPLAVSGLGTGWMQGWVDAHPDRPFARSLQVKLILIYRYTLRTEKASDACDKYMKYFTPEAQPENNDPDEYFQVAYDWCDIGEDLSLSQQWMAYRWSYFLDPPPNGLGYGQSRPNTPEVEHAYRRYDTLLRTH